MSGSRCCPLLVNDVQDLESAALLQSFKSGCDASPRAAEPRQRSAGLCAENAFVPGKDQLGELRTVALFPECVQHGGDALPPVKIKRGVGLRVAADLHDAEAHLREGAGERRAGGGFSNAALPVDRKSVHIKAFLSILLSYFDLLQITQTVQTVTGHEFHVFDFSEHRKTDITARKVSIIFLNA